jgi:hypothetical protein
MYGCAGWGVPLGLLLLMVPSLPNAAATATATNNNPLSSQQQPPKQQHPQKRQVWAWATGGATTAEIQEKAHHIRYQVNGILDGIHLSMNTYFDPHSPGFIVPTDTVWDTLEPIVYAARDTHVAIEIWIHGNFPDPVYDSSTMDPYIQSALDLRDAFETRYRNTTLQGFSFDDERDCTPRSNVTAFQDWIHFQNVFTTAMHTHNLTVSSAIQAMFGIQSSNTTPTAACDQIPSRYPFESQVIQHIQSATIDKWLIMDTYYFNLGRFLTSFDWYRTYFPIHQIAFGLFNDNDQAMNNSEALLGRFYALHQCPTLTQINIFMLPINVRFLPYLRRWKTYCRGCGVQSILGCFDMSIECNDNDDDNNEDAEDNRVNNRIINRNKNNHMTDKKE